VNPTFSLGTYSFANLRALLENRPTSFIGLTPDATFDRQWPFWLIGGYAQDEWHAHPRITITAGLRYEFMTLPIDEGGRDSALINLTDRTATVGQLYAGADYDNFSPRLGVSWDVTGDGRTSIRASAGTFYDFPSNLYLQAFSNGAPFLPRFNRNNVDFENPWANEPGGDPFPLSYGRNVTRTGAIWPTYAVVTTTDYDTKNMQVYQWNLSLQKQVGADWLAAATYLGNSSFHMWAAQEINPAVFLGSTSTTANTNQRRRLSLENPATGQFFGPIAHIDAGATANYNGLILSLERRAGHGITLGGNYTWSHCIGDGQRSNNGQGDQSTVTYLDPNNRRADTANCGSDRRHVINVTGVVETPTFQRPITRMAFTGWRFSGIYKWLTGDYLTVTSGIDRALTGIANQRPNLAILNTYADKSSRPLSVYLNPTAFALPDLGGNGNLGKANILGPSTWQFDVSVSRAFQVREGQRVEFRAEAYNVPNSFRPQDPNTALNSQTFGQIRSSYDPRIMQFALKYVF